MELFNIENIPAVIYGKTSDNVFLFLHGQCGNKEEAARFAEIAEQFGFQTISIDLPEHGKRCDGAKLMPQTVVPELAAVMKYIKNRWHNVNIRANSIGAWFSMLAFRNENIKKCLFVSPVSDMENIIVNMMKTAQVDEKQLERQKTIGDLSWEYLCFVRKNPVRAIGKKTFILYGEKDTLVPTFVIDDFARKNNCKLSVMQGGEHWFHTAEQLRFMTEWETACLSSSKQI